MNIFIVRPFGKKNGIDFSYAGQKELIQPAIKQLGFSAEPPAR